MTRLSETITSPIARDVAFDYIADFARQAEWDPNTVSSTRIDEGELGVGTRFALEVRFGPGVRPMEYRITELDRPSRVVLVGEGSGVWSEDVITFAQTPAGTQVTYAADIRLQGFLGLLQPLLGRAFVSIARGAARGMKRELDARATSAAPSDATTDATAGEGT